MGLVLGKDWKPWKPQIDFIYTVICVSYYIHSDFLSICGYSVIFKTNIKAKIKIYQQFNITQQATNAYQYFIFNYCFFF